MDKKKIIIVLTCCVIGLYSHAQKKYDYQPLTKSQQADIDNMMLTREVSTFLVNDRIPIGPIDLTNVLNMISDNPIEGTRIRISAETNNKMFASNKFLRNRLTLSAMAAYGIGDNNFKYSVGAAFNFAAKPSGVYSFPCSTLSVQWEDNTYSPSYPNYDVAYFSFGSWERFYFASKRQLTLSFLQEFQNSLALRPFFYWQQIYSYVLYDAGNIIEFIDPDIDYINKAAGLELSFSPSRKGLNVLNILNSRFYSLPTKFAMSYSYNLQSYQYDNNYHKLEATAQHRFIFSPMALDFKLTGGKIFGTSNRYMYFTPNYMSSAVSNTFGFNLYSPYEMMFKQYIQTFTQINFGGILLDNIKFFKQFRPNEFVNFKALFTQNNDPYCEVGMGIDHIFALLGLEVIKRLSKENPYEMPQWAVRVRCNL
ncbi:MAG: hypothetical protein IJ759_00705 [Bacteroidales bacterium]|nr:hypothetical protein [Bacteroidales bacterium]